MIEGGLDGAASTGLGRLGGALGTRALGGAASRLPSLGSRMPGGSAVKAGGGSSARAAATKSGGSRGGIGGGGGSSARAVDRSSGGGSPQAGSGRRQETDCHSFDPSTRVLLADSSSRPISALNIGDKVAATDPHSGRTEAKRVTQLHLNQDRNLTDVTVRDKSSGKRTVLKTTEHHPFWDTTERRWVDAGQLTPGHRLLVHDDKRLEGDGTGAGMGGGGPGRQVTVTAVRNHTGNQPMHDLTVADTHTYYVLAGDTPVLVHNNDPAFAGRACDVPRLERSAERINGALDPIAQSQRDTVVMSTESGPDLVASGVRDIDPRQRAAMGGSELEARLPGHHAEVTANERAKDLGLHPRALYSYPHAICPACRQYLEEEGYRISPDGMSAVMRTFRKEN
ncbi:polymorphic toxin-type HINT domain-containing protein [Micromonospora haikouensis]|uniref:polymorphic toxin-type HINT domain-containing protein n=1 Tax=Micromonospora haikouensis TaxID=686309 RepID=UPI003D94CA79